jgi:hypothetical protein
MKLEDKLAIKDLIMEYIDAKGLKVDEVIEYFHSEQIREDLIDPIEVVRRSWQN